MEAQFKDHFSRLAAQYSAFRPLYPAALFDYLVGLCPEHRLAWDCACGSGQASLPLAGYFDAVTATDASAQQIAAASPHPRVTYRVAPAEESGIDAASVDLVTVAQAMHWFDCGAFYREVNRVLRDPGVLAVWSYGNPVVEGEALTRLVTTFYSQTVGEYWPPERRHVEAGYRTLPFPFKEAQTPNFEMSEQWTLEQLLGYLRSWSATGRYVAQHGTDPVVALESDMSQAWGPVEHRRRISWPFILRVGRRS